MESAEEVAATAGGVQRSRVVVTGGSRGIGLECVRVFVSRGHQVLFTYNSSTEEYVRGIEATFPPSTVKAHRLDQGDPVSVQRFRAAVDEWAGDEPIDVLINNAGLGTATVTSYNGLDHRYAGISSDEDVQKSMYAEALMRVNALGPIWVTDALLSKMRGACGNDGRSCVLFVGSVGGGNSSVFPPGLGRVDAMSKAAVAHAAQNYASEYAHSRVDFLCLCPGATGTAMFDKSTLSRLKRPDDFVAQLPKRRLIEPTEVADVLFWLATNSAARIFHGAVLDGSQGLAVRSGLISEYNEGT